MIERQKDHKESVRKAGGRVGGVRPFGFDLDPVTKDNKDAAGLKPNQHEAAAIAGAYAKILAGTSCSAIAREWNEALRTPRKTADPAKTGRGCGGVPWTTGTVKQVLIRAQNAGLVEHKGEITGPATWQAIVAEDSWRAVRAILTDPARNTAPGPKPRHLLTGVLVCGACGSTRFGVVHTRRSTGEPRRYYYTCKAYLSRQGVPGEKRAGHPYRRQDLLDDYAERIIIERLSPS